MSLGAWTNAGGLLDANGELDDMYAALADTCPTVPLDSMQQTYPWFQHAANIHCLTLSLLCQERDKHLKELHGEWTQRAKQAGGNRTLQKVRASGYVGLSSARG